MHKQLAVYGVFQMVHYSKILYFLFAKEKQSTQVVPKTTSKKKKNYNELILFNYLSKLK